MTGRAPGNAPGSAAADDARRGTGRLPETPEVRLKRLRLRSWRRGMREMDLLLGPFADAELADLPIETLDRYEKLLSENDQDLYLWLIRKGGCPRRYHGILRRIAGFHRIE